MAHRPRTPKADPALLATRQQLGKIFGKNPRTIAKWLEEGLPIAVRGRGGKSSLYPIPQCVQWVLKRELAASGGSSASGELFPLQERAKLDKVRREELELKMDVRRGELVPADQVAMEFADIANAVKARMRRIPDSIADRLIAVAARGPAPVKGLLLLEIDDALREMAREIEEPATDADTGSAA